MDPITLIGGLMVTIVGGLVVLIIELRLRKKQTDLPPSEENKKVAIKGRDIKTLSNLPNRDYLEFVGRKNELSTILRILQPNHRIGVITINGIGGIGKSTLALEAAHRCREIGSFYGIVWVSARQKALTIEGIKERKATLRDYDSLCLEIASVIERPDIKRAESKERAKLIYEVLSKKRILLILDNFETVDDEDLMEFLRELPVPSKAIVTTRYRIGVAYDIRLEGMILDEAKRLLINECKKRNVKLDDDNIVQIHIRTGGNPLAMVWIVTQLEVKGYRLETILEGIARSGDDVCHYCFEESLSLLNDDERKLLVALSLLGGIADRSSVSIVAGYNENDVVFEKGLAQLTRLSLVSTHNGRIQVPELVSKYIISELENNPVLEHEIKERWVRHYLIADKTVITLTAYFPIPVSGPIRELIQSMTGEFNRQNPSIFVTPIFTGYYGRSHQKLRDAINIKMPPDIAVLEIAQWLDFIEQGVVIPMESETIKEVCEGSLIDLGFHPLLLSNTTYKGFTWGIPFARSIPLLYCNNNMFKNIGINCYSHPPTCWDEVYSYAREIIDWAKSTKDYGKMGINISMEDWWLPIFTRQAGGNLLNESKTFLYFESNEALEAMCFWSGLVKEGLARPSESWFDAPLDFINGRVAMLYHTSGTNIFLKNNANFEIISCPLPFKRIPASEFGGGNFVIMANRPKINQQASWIFIDWFTQIQQTMRWASITGYYPVRLSSYYDISNELSGGSSYQKGDATLLQALSHTFERTSVSYYERFRLIMLDMISSCLNREIDEVTLLKNLQQKSIELAESVKESQ